MNFLVFLCGQLPIAFGSYSAARRLSGAQNQAVQDNVVLVLALQFHLALNISLGMLLGIFGCLTLPYLMIGSWLVGILLLVCCRAIQPSRDREGMAGIPLENRPFPRQPLGTMTRLPCFFAAFIICLVALNSFLAPDYEYDVLTYHLFFPARWIQDARISIIPTWFGDPAPAYAPAATEVWHAILMLPFHDDTLARLGQFPFWIMLLAVVAAILREFRVSRDARAWTCCFVAMIPTMSRQAGTAMVDVALAAHLLSVGLFLHRSGRTRTVGDIVGLITAIGLLIGTKFIGIVFLLALSPLFIVAILSSRGKRRGPVGRIRFASMCLAAVAALNALWIGGYGYARNFALTGNPVYPMTLTLADHVIFPGAYGRPQMANLPYNVARNSGWSGFRDVLTQSLAAAPTTSAPSWLHSLKRIKPELTAGLVGGLLILAILSIGMDHRRRAMHLAWALSALSAMALFWFAIPFQQSRFMWGPLMMLLIAGVAGAQSLDTRRSWLPRLLFGAAVVWIVSAGDWNALLIQPPVTVTLFAMFAALGFSWWLSQLHARSPKTFANGENPLRHIQQSRDSEQSRDREGAVGVHSVGRPEFHPPRENQLHSVMLPSAPTSKRRKSASLFSHLTDSPQSQSPRPATPSFMLSHKSSSGSASAMILKATTVFILLLGGLLLVHEGGHRSSRAIAFDSQRWTGLGPLWKWIDARTSPTSIAYVGNNVPYFLLGPRLNNRVAYVPARSPSKGVFHEFAADPDYVRLGPPNTSEPAPDRRVMDPRKWLENLHDAQIEFVILFPVFSATVVNYRHDLEGFTLERRWLNKWADACAADPRPLISRVHIPGTTARVYRFDWPSTDDLEPTLASLPKLPSVLQDETDALDRRRRDNTPPDQPIRYYPYAAWIIKSEQRVELPRP